MFAETPLLSASMPSRHTICWKAWPKLGGCARTLREPLAALAIGGRSIQSFSSVVMQKAQELQHAQGSHHDEMALCTSCTSCTSRNCPRLDMTRAIRFTQASLRRAIEAARKAGLRVTGIKPDGTLIVDEQDNPQEMDSLEKKREVVL